MTALIKNSTKRKPTWLKAVHTNDNAAFQTTVKRAEPQLKTINGEPISWQELSGDLSDITAESMSWDELF